MLPIARIAALQLLMFTVLTGVLYPVAVTFFAQSVFPYAANGSMIERDGRKLGSALIGQPFDSPKYFWSRPSATGSFPYNSLASSGSNQGPTNPALVDAVRERIARLKEYDPGNNAPIPVDLVTASASGLDPHISVASAIYQAPRVARFRGLPESEVQQFIEQYRETSMFHVPGQPCINVLNLNLALDAQRRDLPGED
jgi:K+-transporting ATPase ATPase C chain